MNDEPLQYLYAFEWSQFAKSDDLHYSMEDAVSLLKYIQSIELVNHYDRPIPLKLQLFASDRN